MIGRRWLELGRGDGARAKALRGSGFTIVLIVGQNLLRLASNMVLTRLLVPEAFGLMAIVQVFLFGLQMVSDMGIRGSVVQNERGDERAFLDTAWTLQILRGLLLWGLACLVAVPAAAIYGEPLLAQLLPVAGLTLVVSGFRTTKVLTADRHIALGRLTLLQLAAQLAGLAVLAALAFALRSVWALAIGSVIGAAITVAVTSLLLPGPGNRLRVERESARELIRFGKYIFLTSLATFAVKQSDRAILGAYLPLALFGVYNIGWSLAGLPSMVARALGEKILFPLYRMRHPLDGGGNRRAMLRARRLVVGAGLATSAAAAFLGVWLVELLFDPRYALAGPVVVVVATGLVPAIVTTGTIRAATAKGDSRSFFLVTASTAVLQVALIFLGLEALGLLGAVAAIAVAPVLTYPLLARIAHRYRSLDLKGDAAFLAAGLGLHLWACWIHRDAIAALAAAG